MTPAELRTFLRAQLWAIEATATPLGAPQAAVIGVAVTDSLELVFDTLTTSRKHANLEHDPRIALVIGWDDARTAQIEGVADRPDGADLERVREIYLARFPDGQERANLPAIAYWRVRPTWIRFSDFTEDPPSITEWDADDLASGNPDSRR
jgi:uncharacterized protein YhbP (UPF0306 family)